MNTNLFDLFALITLLLLIVVTPLLGMWDFRRLLRWVAEGRSDARVKSYNWILITQWTLTLALLGWWILAGRNLTTIGLVPAAAGWQWLAIGLGVAAVAFQIWQMVSVLRSPHQLAKVRDQMGELSDLAPQSAREDRLFGLVSITAGVCEEILYRGLLLAVLVPVVGTWPAVLLSSLIFGLGHAYQGATGIAKTTFVGLILAVLAVFSGSIFVPMLLHAVIDLTSGRMMGAALREAPAT